MIHMIFRNLLQAPGPMIGRKARFPRFATKQAVKYTFDRSIDKN